MGAGSLTFIDGLQGIHQVLLKLLLCHGVLQANYPLRLDKAAHGLGQLWLQCRVSLCLAHISSLLRVILL